MKIVSVDRRVKIKKPGPRLLTKLGGLAFLCVLSALMNVGSVAAAEIREMAMIAGKSFPVDTLTLDGIKEIYKGEKQLIAGVRLKPIDQRDSQTIRSQFLNKVLNFSGDEYVTYWNNRLFREGGIPPIPQNNSGEVITMVQETDGAIGYVWLDETTAAKANLRILLTIHVRQ
ncbi:MAG: hypothetical protein HY203_04105 [Nitrospirae bacterium]|nr:hypothetical protein [Nitrospirota bacterium]